MGKITLLVTFGDFSNPRTEYFVFDVVNHNYPYNAIFGRGTINAFDAVIHQSYLTLKMPATLGVIIVKGDKQKARDIEKCFTPGQSNVHHIEVFTAEQIEDAKQQKDRRDHLAKNAKEERTLSDKESVAIQSDEEIKKLLLDDQVYGQFIIIGTSLAPNEESELLTFLCKNKDVFACSSKDLEGVNREVIEHKLTVSDEVKPNVDIS